MKLLVIISILFVSISCSENNHKFNSREWKYIDGSYNHRDKMLVDLMENILHKGMKYVEVEKLLGKPNENKFSNEITYEIYYDFNYEDRRTLTIYFSNDSSITKYERKVWD